MFMLTVRVSMVRDGEGGGEEKVVGINGREGKVGLASLPTRSGTEGAQSLGGWPKIKSLERVWPMAKSLTMGWPMVKSLAKGLSEDLLEGLSSLTDTSSNWSLSSIVGDCDMWR